MKNDWFSKLTDAERKIWYLIFYHPTHITSRAIALDWLFCINGSGMEWVNGEIGDTIDDNYLNAKEPDRHNLDDDIYKQAWSNSFGVGSSLDKLAKWQYKFKRSYNYYQNCLTQHVLDNIEKLVTTSVPIKRFYPISKYSNIARIPRNAKPDWIKLAIETCDLIVVCDPLYKPKNMTTVNASNIRWAKKIKPRLEKRLNLILDNKS